MSYVANKDYLSQAAARLHAGLAYDQTPEGYNFWYAVYRRLNKLGGGFLPAEPLWKEYGLGVHSDANKENKERIATLEATLALRDQEVTRLTAERDKFRKKLLAADFTSMGR